MKHSADPKRTPLALELFRVTYFCSSLMAIRQKSGLKAINLTTDSLREDLQLMADISKFFICSKPAEELFNCYNVYALSIRPSQHLLLNAAESSVVNLTFMFLQQATCIIYRKRSNWAQKCKKKTLHGRNNTTSRPTLWRLRSSKVYL